MIGLVIVLALIFGIALLVYIFGDTKTIEIKKQCRDRPPYPMIYYQFEDGSTVDYFKVKLNKHLNENYDKIIQSKGKITCRFNVYYKIEAIKKYKVN